MVRVASALPCRHVPEPMSWEIPAAVRPACGSPKALQRQRRSVRATSLECFYTCTLFFLVLNIFCFLGFLRRGLVFQDEVKHL